ETRVMLTMESRIHGDMYVRFGGRLVETYHRKVAKRYWPSLLKEIADICGIKKNLTFHLARHTFATTTTLSKGVPIETVSKMLGHTNIETTQIYARITNSKIGSDMQGLDKKFVGIEKIYKEVAM
ncbi:tyrosine-type recombinase/integrase, partial [Bacteroides hominis]|uniref:tyrosine-type recombinase/integrase n=1 Tax=Bacteroides hominis TaxID=2763023 RepID=UPI002287F5EF|nr:tyrosine-type recombinase/integrase [Bacteroides fragilis]